MKFFLSHVAMIIILLSWAIPGTAALLTTSTSAEISRLCYLVVNLDKMNYDIVHRDVNSSAHTIQYHEDE